MTKFKRRSVVIEAIQWKGHDHLCEYIEKAKYMPAELYKICYSCGCINGGHGDVNGGGRICPGDWLIIETDGKMHACHPSIFKAIYEEAK